MSRIIKKPEVRKLEIVKAARYLFQQKGYDLTTVQDVMDYLKIAKGTVYHYFKSKEEILEAVIENIVGADIEKKKLLFKEMKGNALENIRTLMASGSMDTDNDQILQHLHQPGNSGMHIRLLAAAISKQAPLYCDLIRQGCEEGIFQTNTPLECAEFILAGIQFLTDLGIYNWSQEELMRRVMAFPAIIEAQLKAAPGSFQFLINQI
jgi:AcrR family transcriptional regulator